MCKKEVLDKVQTSTGVPTEIGIIKNGKTDESVVASDSKITDHQSQIENDVVEEVSSQSKEIRQNDKVLSSNESRTEEGAKEDVKSDESKSKIIDHQSQNVQINNDEVEQVPSQSDDGEYEEDFSLNQPHAPTEVTKEVCAMEDVKNVELREVLKNTINDLQIQNVQLNTVVDEESFSKNEGGMRECAKFLKQLQTTEVRTGKRLMPEDSVETINSRIDVFIKNEKIVAQQIREILHSDAQRDTDPNRQSEHLKVLLSAYENIDTSIKELVIFCSGLLDKVQTMIDMKFTIIAELEDLIEEETRMERTVNLKKQENQETQEA